jgi:hypothetical protein
MTGQIAFARTIRALDADDSRGSKLGLLLALVLLACWTWWALAASIPQYEVSGDVRLESGRNAALADFPATSRIRPGQPVEIVSNEGHLIQGQVANVQNEPTGSIHVQFKLSPPAVATTHQPPATWRASVEVARVSPAAIVLRALR